jgi:hypothetical protein
MRATLLLTATLTLPVFAGGTSALPCSRRTSGRDSSGVREAESSPDAGINNSILTRAALAYRTHRSSVFVSNAYSFPF